jgi:hypothetical protein
MERGEWEDPPYGNYTLGKVDNRPFLVSWRRRTIIVKIRTMLSRRPPRTGVTGQDWNVFVAPHQTSNGSLILPHPRKH